MDSGGREVFLHFSQIIDLHTSSKNWFTYKLQVHKNCK